MSWLSKQLKSAKKMVTHPRDWLSNALPTLGAMSGNPLGLAASSAAATALDKDKPFTLGQIGNKAFEGLKTGAGIGAAGLAGSFALPAIGGALPGLGKGALSVLGTVGKGALDSLGNTFMNPEGGVDMGRVMAALGALSSMKGSRDQSKAASGFNAANAAMRQKLMDRLLQSPNYDFTPSN